MASIVCINESLSDDELRSVLRKLKRKRDRLAFGLVCKRWLYLQSAETKAIRPYSPHMLPKLAARFTSVVELRFVCPGRVKDLDLGVIADRFRCLRYLSLWGNWGCKEITDAGMVKIAEGCVNLQSLHIGGCKDVTDKVLQVLSKNCHNLEELGMQECTNITDSGLKSLVSGCELIKWLDISFCRKITVMGIGVLLNKCHSLEYLDVMSCPHVTKLGCDEAGLQFPKCCRLKIQH